MANLEDQLGTGAAATTLEANGPMALRDLRRELGSLLGSLGPFRRAVQLSERLSLDRSLAWKIWRVAQGPDDLPSPKHVPGRGGMSLFLRAAEQQGAPQVRVQAVREAHLRFQEIVREHAGDRASADILLGQFTDEGRSRLEIQLRREAFHAYSHLLGVRMQTRHQLDIIAPSPREFMPRLARVRGYYGLQRTRLDARWVLSRGYVMQEGGPTANYVRTPLASGGGGDAGSVPIVPEFCHPSDLPLRRTHADGHTVVDELGPGPIGAAGAADIVTAELISGVPRKPTSREVIGVHVRTPSERLCYEVYIHREILRETLPVLEVFTTLNLNSPQGSPDPRDRIPVSESLRAFGPADTAPPPIEVPRHGDLMRWAFSRLDWDPSEFQVFRFLMRFPPVAIVLRAAYDLPD